MLSHLFRLATLAKGAVALSLVTGVYGAASTNLADQRPIVAAVHMDFTNQVIPTPEPLAKGETRDGTKKTEVANPSVEALVRECATKYARLSSFKDAPSAEREEAGRLVKEVCERAMKASGLEADAFWAKYKSLFGLSTKNSEETKRSDANKNHEPDASFEGLLKECATSYAGLASSKGMPRAEREEAGRLVRDVCERAMKASGLAADAFWAKYRSLFAHSTTKNEETKRPETTTRGEQDPSFEALFKECVTKYARAIAVREATTAEREEAGRLAKDACERAIKASGLETGAFWAKYGRYMTPTAKLEPTTSPKPAASPKPVVTDPLVRECYAKYQELATLRSGAVEAYEAAVRTFNENCRRVLEASHN